MRTTDLNKDAAFHDLHAHSEPLYVDADGRVLRFALRPGQRIEEHNAPGSPFYVVVLSGQGFFTGGDGSERSVGPNTLLIFDPGENHSVRAGKEDLVFVGFLHGVASTRPNRIGGTIGRGGTAQEPHGDGN